MDESSHFRSRAKQCRDLANHAKDDASRRELSDMADQLDAEADQIEEGEPDDV